MSPTSSIDSPQMPCLNSIPTEMLCEVFKLVTGSVDGGITDPTIAAQDSSGIIPWGTAVPKIDAFRLPDLTTNIPSALTLSHVCKRWQKIVLDRPEMWQRVFISPRHLAKDLSAISAEILMRSRSYPLHLDIYLMDCQHNSQEGSRYIYQEARRLLTDVHIARCESLRIEGPHWPLYYILWLFRCHNHQVHGSDLDPAGIKWLHIIADPKQGNIGSLPTFHMRFIAPRLICLDAQLAPVYSFPSGMDRILFDTRLISRHTYWDALTVSQAKHIILSKVRIPAPLSYQVGQHMAQENIANRAKYFSRTESRLVSITFHKLRHWASNVDSGESIRAAHQFFEETFLERVATTLEKVRLMDLNGETWAGFISACRTLQFDFPNVHSLVLKDVTILTGDDDFVLLGRVFPDLKSLRVEGMRLLHGFNLLDTWTKNRSLWPNLQEIGYGDWLAEE